MNNQPILTLQGELYTNFSGVRNLFDFYHKANDYSNTTVYIDMYHLGWIDANLSSLFHAILFKLGKENNLKFSTDLNFLKSKFDVLFRNGLFVTGNEVVDERQSTVVLKEFASDDDKGFIKYIKDDLLNHRGMPNFSENVKKGILNELIEVQNNILLHAKTPFPLFVCGQYYPRQNALIFSIVDLGVGFLPAIKTKTNGEVGNDYEAIIWALEKGNTTKTDCPGGLGLYNLKEYCKKNNSNIQIITGNTFWSSEFETTIFDYREFSNPFVGTIINLLFSDKIR